MSSIGEELASVREKISKIPNTELITCHPSLVQIKIRYIHFIHCTCIHIHYYTYRQTEHRQVSVCCQFPENYPTEPLIGIYTVQYKYCEVHIY